MRSASRVTIDLDNKPTGSAPPPAVAVSPRLRLAAVLRLLRPRQWIKNVFVLAPLLFAQRFHDPRSVSEALQAMVIFTLASCVVYVLNDLQDLTADRQHPTKRYTRPLASGEVSQDTARVLLGVLATGFVLSIFMVPAITAVAGAYLALNVGYSLRLKRVPVVDLFCLASGFVLRVFAGAVAISVPLSSWMLITTLSLSLYLAAIKRREELSRSGHGAREVLGSYTPGLLDRYALIAAASAIVFYSLFVMTVRPGLVVTIPLVLFGLFRYWYVVESAGVGESPTDALLRDIPLALTVVGWAALCTIRLM
jgi:decaprenyl-phosphate phosphoribosyltransferase